VSQNFKVVDVVVELVELELLELPGTHPSDRKKREEREFGHGQTSNLFLNL
jgi:hypothetical protein